MAISRIVRRTVVTLNGKLVKLESAASEMETGFLNISSPEFADHFCKFDLFLSLSQGLQATFLTF